MKCYLITTRHESIFGKNWLMFWCNNNKGYTSDIRNADIYNIDKNNSDYPVLTSKEEAFKFKSYGDYYLSTETIETEFKEFHLIEK
jgi:hypothetical protein